MNIIDHVLQQVAYSISAGEYIWTDHEQVAIVGDYLGEDNLNTIYTTANAFLNTKGGIIILGITDDEDNGRYLLNELADLSKFEITALAKAFSNLNGDLVEAGNFISTTVKPFLHSQVLVITLQPLSEENKYYFYQGLAWQRQLAGNQRIPNLKAPVTTAPNAISLASVTENTGEETIPVEEFIEHSSVSQPANKTTEEQFQKIYSAELISLFGADYISLEPDYKQMLSFIYERNNEEEVKYPDANDISSRLWVIRGEIATPNGYELYQQKVKKILQMMEKTGFIIRYKGRQEYLINTSYELVKNLFN